MLDEVVGDRATAGLAYVCGPTQLVEQAATLLVGRGYPPAKIKTERFGPTGG
jgi:ferredoxin-NADP reductase